MLQRDDVLEDLDRLSDLVARGLDRAGHFFEGRLPAEPLRQPPSRLGDPLIRFGHVHGHPDGAGLIRQRAGDPLADPPGGIGAELEPAPVVESLRRLHQAHIAFLDKVQKAHAPAVVVLGDVHDEAQIGQDHFFLGLFQLGPPFVVLLQSGLRLLSLVSHSTTRPVDLVDDLLDGTLPFLEIRRRESADADHGFQVRLAGFQRLRLAELARQGQDRAESVAHLPIALLDSLPQRDLVITRQQGLRAEGLEIQPFQLGKVRLGRRRLLGVGCAGTFHSLHQQCLWHGSRQRVLIGLPNHGILLQQHPVFRQIIHHRLAFAVSCNLYHIYGHVNALRCLIPSMEIILLTVKIF